jgi:phosphate transport system permease protein
MQDTKSQNVNLKLKKKFLSTDRLMPMVLGFFALISILTTIGIVVILITESSNFFRDVSLFTYLSGKEWTPQFAEPKFGVLPLITGTLMITVIGCVVAIPIGLGCAIYLSEYAPDRVRSILKPTLEILAGIPTIVYGFFALSFVTPLLQKLLPHLQVLL